MSFSLRCVALPSRCGVARVSFGSLLYRIALGAAVRALEQAADGRSVEAGPAMTYEQVQALAPEPAV